MRTSLLVVSAPLLGLLLGACGEEKDGPTSASNSAAVTGVVGVGGAGGEGGAGGLGGAGGSDVPQECDDGVLSGDETDVDCGGPCEPCEIDQACGAPTDCDTEECTDDICTACADGKKNGTETDIDCGGLCDPCDLEQKCVEGEDCVTGVCFTGTCINPGCGDAIQNGTETGIDCGGPVCVARCPGDQGCADGDDCESTICVDAEPPSPYEKVCTIPTCEDGVKNFGETDQDCGGDNCPQCRGGQLCEGPSDCVTGDCTAGQCACPDDMVTVPVLNGGAYCIDQAEVTYELYKVFADANPVYDDPECAFNTGVDNNYTPSSLWPPEDDDALAANYKFRPVRYVDWCDARAYCRWAGKRLCGAIEPVEGELMPQSEIDNPLVSQWFNACTNQGTNDYPYGDTFSEGEGCVESVGGPVITPSAVRNMGGFFDVCEGGVQSLHHMSGNVAEWEDACSAAVGANDECPVRGGSFTSEGAGDVSCRGPVDGQGQSIPVTLPRETRSADIGFRCCQ